MNSKLLFSLITSLIIVNFALAQKAIIPASQDTVYITASPFNQSAGELETTINGDTTVTGARANPNRVYALNEGQIYYQLASINVYNPTGTLTIVGVPSLYGKTKPVILIQPTNGMDVNIRGAAVNQVYGSIRLVNIHYQTMQMDGNITLELFYCGTANKLPQSLMIDNCLFEFCNIDLFDCTNETNAIGGWPFGAKFRITNSYFRNLFNPQQWWGSGIIKCQHPIDTLWVENVTITGGGLTFMQYNALTAFAYFNHNTIINNHKYWLLSPYYINYIVVNNLFINQNWVGEDTNVVSIQYPTPELQGTIDIDTVSAGKYVAVQQKYYLGDSSHYVPLLSPWNMKVFVWNNVNYYDPLLINGYYKSSIYIDPTLGTPPSYLTWAGLGSGPWNIENIPCMWMNPRTQSLFSKFSPANGGGFIGDNTITVDPHTYTSGISDASVVDEMAEWNQNQWGDPRFPNPPDITHSKYIFGDYDPTTIPGILNGIKTENSGTGITKFTDLKENFSQNTVISKIDSLPVGSLIWDDAKFAAYNSETEWAKVQYAYISAGGPIPTDGIKTLNVLPYTYSLSQNYPNPFNPSTVISWQLAKSSFVTLKVYDVLGREVKSLLNEQQAAGNHSVIFNAVELTSGIYFYRITAGEFTDVKKSILLK